MSGPIPVCAPDAMRPIHQERLACGAPLDPALLRELAAIEHGLFEFLSDRPVAGNTEAAAPGHRHGRQSGDGLYLPRHGVIAPGFILPQSSASDSYTPVRFTHLNISGPDASGEEVQSGSVSTAKAAAFLHSDYTRLLFPVLLKAEAETTAIARLSLFCGEVLRISDSRQTDALQWTPCWFDLPIAASPEFNGWHHLVLELRSAQAGKLAFIAAADERFKPMPGALGNAAAFLIGESP